ncbi:spheroidene monooxygenase [Hymenobacter sp. 15J16-1T3B]|uniref:spheroidene monooxygenase n=1 Tax=Hymenobacter sp. 15J16-1T3B TaxID=2886941 RepID=UPI001D1148FC|nr:spheroidene monooxygenase [Hymenobacter sp. 15J16-1T3B]MCC3158949.1 spheroidene monooxygenase [Hymenobacter sp. 15J16-1T3B]
MSLTTLSIITVRPDARRWALARMGTVPPQLRRVPGLLFSKLLGSGFDFGLRPNFQRYGFMASWADEAAAQAFFAGHHVWQAYEQRSQELWTAYLQPLQAHGLWDGQHRFDAGSAAPPAPSAPVAVLTRASIRPLRAWSFWRAVPPVSRAVADAPGLLAAIGLGELPVLRQATFSLWESGQLMQQYAYGAQHDGRHREVVRRTRQEGWYSEELFARFAVQRTDGLWDGRNPLPLR